MRHFSRLYSPAPDSHIRFEFACLARTGQCCHSAAFCTTVCILTTVSTTQHIYTTGGHVLLDLKTIRSATFSGLPICTSRFREVMLTVALVACPSKLPEVHNGLDHSIQLVERLCWQPPNPPYPFHPLPHPSHPNPQRSIPNPTPRLPTSCVRCTHNHS